MIFWIWILNCSANEKSFPFRGSSLWNETGFQTSPKKWFSRWQHRTNSGKTVPIGSSLNRFSKPSLILPLIQTKLREQRSQPGRWQSMNSILYSTGWLTTVLSLNGLKETISKKLGSKNDRPIKLYYKEPNNQGQLVTAHVKCEINYLPQFFLEFLHQVDAQLFHCWHGKLLIFLWMQTNPKTWCLRYIINIIRWLKNQEHDHQMVQVHLIAWLFATWEKSEFWNARDCKYMLLFWDPFLLETCFWVGCTDAWLYQKSEDWWGTPETPKLTNHATVHSLQLKQLRTNGGWETISQLPSAPGPVIGDLEHLGVSPKPN